MNLEIVTKTTDEKLGGRFILRKKFVVKWQPVSTH